MTLSWLHYNNVITIYFYKKKKKKEEAPIIYKYPAGPLNCRLAKRKSTISKCLSLIDLEPVVQNTTLQLETWHMSVLYYSQHHI